MAAISVKCGASIHPRRLVSDNNNGRTGKAPPEKGVFKTICRHASLVSPIQVIILVGISSGLRSKLALCHVLNLPLEPLLVISRIFDSRYSSMSIPSDTLVLVTGGSGFLGAHCIIALLNAGYKVRTTVRSLGKKDVVIKMLKNGDIADSQLSNVSFAAADLTKDDGWSDAVSGCTYVLHVASPFPANVPKNEDELIIPARDGTLRVLRAAKSAGVKRVVVTSSFVAIGYGHANQDRVFNEESWTNLDNPIVAPYGRSKTIAEKAAWDFVKSKDGEGLELSVVNPVGIFGPILGPDFATSILIVQRLLEGFPGCPQLFLGIVDVRDVASLHLLAMTHEKAAGERFLAISPPGMTIQEAAFVLKKRLPDATKKTPTRTVPNFLIRFLALFDSEVGMIVPELGKKKDGTNEKARTLLGWNPRSPEDALVASAESLIKFDLIKK
jgi:nucleoside-diphosphate-sugar epimerase